MATQKKSPQEDKVGRLAVKIANFKKLANKRVTKVLNGLDGIANLSNKNSYTYDAAQAAKIVAALKAGVDAVEKRFAASAAGTVAGFEV